MTTLIILSISLIFLAVITALFISILNTCNEYQKNKLSFYGMIISSTLVLANLLLFLTSLQNKVEPIDVYRNKTELKINVETLNGDTINCDSTVVWKSFK